MSLMPIVMPVAPANTAGAEDPATTGSGDFTALLAALVGMASTLPVQPPPEMAAGDGAPLPSEASNAEMAALAAELPPAALAESPLPATAEMPGENLPWAMAADLSARPAPSQPAVPGEEEEKVEPPALTPEPSGATPDHRDRRPETMTLPEAAHFERPPLGLPPADAIEVIAPPRAAGRPVAPAGPAGQPAPVVPLTAARTEAPLPVDAPPAASSAPVSIPEQIVSAVVPLHGRGDGRHEITLELRPDHLGTIRVEMSVEHETVHLTLHAAEPATGRLLSASLGDLRAALADAGLTAGQVGVGLAGGGTRHRREAGDTDDADLPRPAMTGAAGEIARPVRPVRLAAAGRLDLFL